MAKKKKPASDQKLAAGPRKRRRKGPPEARKSTHKKRAQWFRARAAWPNRDASGEHLATQREKIKVQPAAVPADRQWEAIGPTNIGGRLTSLAVHPGDPDVFWVGAAGGGVWKTEDGGSTWKNLWHKQGSLNIGALAVDTKAPDTVYAATGEADLSADSYPGVGIYRSSDGGATWTLWAPVKQFQLPRRIGVVAIDPFDSKHIRIGGVSHIETEPSGLFVTTDGGVTWTRENFVSPLGYFCHAIVFHPTKPGVIFAGIFERGAQSGIWRTTDGGANWTHLTTGLPSADSFRRTSLAVAPSKPDTIYALASDAEEGVLGVFVSKNMGNTWASIGGSHFSEEGQMSYGNTIVVHPTDPDHVLCGGVDLHGTTDGGSTWKQVTHWDFDRGEAEYAHADHHCLVMPAGAPGRVYDCNDGGLDRSDDGGGNWQNLSNGLAVTMYYDLDVAPSDPRSFGGGTQDNGTNVTTDGKPDTHFEILGGDGGWMVYNPQSAGKVFASYYNFHIFRFRGSTPPKNVSPPAPKSEQNSVWMCYITYDPNEPKTIFTGTFRVWKTTNEGTSWKAVSGNLDDSPITAIEVAPANSKFVYVGTENGGLFRSVDSGKTWSGNIAGAVSPGRQITRIETHPAKAQTLVVTVAGTGSSHVFRSVDGGLTWTDIDQGKLPAVPHSAAVVPPDDANALYVANDAGVYLTNDGGGSWTNLTRNLPNVMVVDLVYHQGEGVLWAATYGRSIWRIKIK